MKRLKMGKFKHMKFLRRNSMKITGKNTYFRPKTVRQSRISDHIDANDFLKKYPKINRVEFFKLLYSNDTAIRMICMTTCLGDIIFLEKSMITYLKKNRKWIKSIQ